MHNLVKPKFITFTGLDENTNLDTVQYLSELFPIEWGVLFAGRDGPRYPSREWIKRLVSDYPTIRLAAHLCGKYAARVNTGLELELDLYGFNRIQINTVNADIDAISGFSESNGVRCIVQHRTLRYPHDDRVDWLFDQSGGRGLTASQYPLHHEDGNIYGYSGGFGPHNVTEVVRSMDAVVSSDPKNAYWIDMETNVRTNDWLDLYKCAQVCASVYAPPEVVG